jgi:hypothetical protein
VRLAVCGAGLRTIRVHIGPALAKRARQTLHLEGRDLRAERTRGAVFVGSACVAVHGQLEQAVAGAVPTDGSLRAVAVLARNALVPMCWELRAELEFLVAVMVVVAV